MEIDIYLGDTDAHCFEQGMHPKTQVEKIKTKRFFKHEVVFTNSAYVLEAINKYHKNLEWTIYYENKKISKTEAFDSLSKPFQKLIFGE